MSSKFSRVVLAATILALSACASSSVTSEEREPASEINRAPAQVGPAAAAGGAQPNICGPALKKLTQPVDRKSTAAAVKASEKLTLNLARVRPTAGVKFRRAFTKSIRNLLRRMNGHKWGVGSLEDTTKAIAHSKIAPWIGREDLLDIPAGPITDAQRAFAAKFFDMEIGEELTKPQLDALENLRNFIEESKTLIGYDASTGKSVVGQDVRSFAAQVKSFNAEQNSIIGEYAQVKYELTTLEWYLDGQRKTGDAATDKLRAEIAETFRKHGSVAFDIPAFGKRKSTVATWGSEEIAKERRKELKKLLKSLEKKSSERSSLQALLIRRLETHATIIDEEMFKARKKFGSDLPLPPEWQQIRGMIASLRKETEGSKEFLPEFMPPSWTWNKLTRVQIWEEIRNWFKTRKAAIKDPKVQANLEQFKKWLETAERVKDEHFEKLGLRHLKTDYESLRNWRFIRIGLLAAGALTTGGTAATRGGSDDDHDDDWIDRLLELITPGTMQRQSRTACMEAVADEEIEKACREYLSHIVSLPKLLKMRGHDHNLTVIAKGGEFVDPELSKIVIQIMVDRQKTMTDRRRAEEVSDAMFNTIADFEPISRAYRDNLIKGIPLTRAEEARKLLPRDKFRQAMIVKNTLNEDRYPILRELDATSKASLELSYTEARHPKAMRSEVSSKLVKEMIDYHYDAERLIDEHLAYLGKLPVIPVDEQDRAERDNRYRLMTELVRARQDKIMTRVRQLAQMREGQDVTQPTYMSGAASDLQDILTMRLDNRNAEIEDLLIDQREAEAKATAEKDRLQLIEDRRTAEEQKKEEERLKAEEEAAKREEEEAARREAEGGGGDDTPIDSNGEEIFGGDPRPEEAQPKAEAPKKDRKKPRN